MRYIVLLERTDGLPTIIMDQHGNPLLYKDLAEAELHAGSLHASFMIIEWPFGEAKNN